MHGHWLKGYLRDGKEIEGGGGGSGGGGVFVVSKVPNSDSETGYALDASYNDLKHAYDDGKILVLKEFDDYEGSRTDYQLFLNELMDSGPSEYRTYTVSFSNAGSTSRFSASAPDAPLLGVTD